MQKQSSISGSTTVSAVPATRFWLTVSIVTIAAIGGFILVGSYVRALNVHTLEHCHTNFAHVLTYGHSHCTASPAHILNVWK